MVSLNRILLIICFITTAAAAQETKAPVAVSFTIKDAGYVTLVIENAQGQRVRNLISQTWFKPGKHTVYWDVLDDLGRDHEAARHGIYVIPSKLVLPGKYVVRGLVHPKIKTTYEFPVYANGNPPWNTKDHTGAWLGNHSAPQAAVFVPASQSPTHEPAVFIGCYVTEGADGVAWLDLNGRKMGGKGWVGGIWTGAPFMARDAGDRALPNSSVYVASVWETGKKSGLAELRISSMYKNPEKPIFLTRLGPVVKGSRLTEGIGGFAVRNGMAAVSLTDRNQILIIDLKNLKVTDTLAAGQPRGLAFDRKGRLLVLSGNTLLRYNDISTTKNTLLTNSNIIDFVPRNASKLIDARLDSPVGITQDNQNNIYISNGGKSHQVKVYTAEGVFLRDIGTAGPPQSGEYDPLHMNNPAGMTVDSKNQLWVTEKDFLPKRVSVWSLEGKLLNAFYGPSKYGGGGTLDPEDKSRFYYAEQELGTMEFKLDWKTGKSKLDRILYRKVPGMMELPLRSAGPETPLYHNGKRYFTNSYNASPTGGAATAFLFAERNGILEPVAAMGKTDAWPLLKDRSLSQGRDKNTFFIWKDLNEDAKVQTNELSFEKAEVNGVTVMPDLSFCITQFNGSALQFFPVSFTPDSLPVYQIGQRQVLASGVQSPASTGGGQTLAAAGGYTVVTQGIQPFDRYSLSGARNGKAMWSYPNLWPGLHASHEAPIPDFPGELVGPTRLLGGVFYAGKSTGEPLWAVNSNHGMVYIFTADGIFVTQLFEPMRGGLQWNMPVATRGMDLEGLTLGEENFWPGIAGTRDGEVYTIDGSRSSLIKIEGLQHIQRIQTGTVTVNDEDLKKAVAYQLKKETLRQEKGADSVLKVLLSTVPIVIDGKWDDWKQASWVPIDKRGVKANFNSSSRPYDVIASLAVQGGRLCAAYHTGDKNLLRNSFEMPLAAFKTGGALDIMLATQPSADPKRKQPVKGDVRLLVTVSLGKAHALLYEAVVPQTNDAVKVPFSSPSRTIMFDRVRDVTGQLEFASDGSGGFEFSVPLSILDLMPASGVIVKGDIGILRGDGVQTLSRVYWNNKGTAIVSDVPSEAELVPGLWGRFKFVTP